ncbi:MAG: hypothetical protein U0R19_38350 [Bryobacteraceae bacterium]
MIEGLTEQGFDDGLAAHVEACGAFIEFPQHSLRQVHVDPAHWADHRELIGKKLRDILTLSAISSAEGEVLDLRGIGFLFLAGRFAGRNQMEVFSIFVLANLKCRHTLCGNRWRLRPA